MTISNDFNMYMQFDQITADLKRIASEKGIDLSKIKISNCEIKRKEKPRREVWNYN